MPPVRGGFAAENLSFTVLCDHISRFFEDSDPGFFRSRDESGDKPSVLALVSMIIKGRSRGLGVSPLEGEEGWKDLAHFQAAELSRSESENA
jgi:hypothetical protein